MQRVIPPVVKSSTGFLIGLWGGLHPLIQALMLLMPLDVILGIWASGKEKRLSSDHCFKGLVRKKVVMLFLVAAGAVVDRVFNFQFTVLTHQVGLGAAVAGSFLVHELLSLVENSARLGVGYPKPLLDALEKLKFIAPKDDVIPEPEEEHESQLSR